MKVYKVKVNGKVYEVEVEAVSESAGSIAAPEVNREKPQVVEGDKVIIAPISGKISEVRVKPGETIKKGQTVMIIEAMKLENEIQSPYDGKVVSIAVDKGDDVKNKETLIVLE